MMKKRTTEDTPGHGEIRGKREFLDKFDIHGTATFR
jgi:hypothetical protein